ncbi:MAG TPA: NUDIX domain-containing protein [Candidatus Saccharimonadales bacterium]
MGKTIQKRSAGGIVYSDGKILALRAIPQGEIILPKGTIEEGETPEQTAVREIFEETGYKTKIIAHLGSISYEFDEGDGKHYRKTVYHYLLELEDATREPTPNRMEGEDFENVWFFIDEAFERLTHNDSKNMLKKALAILGLG